MYTKADYDITKLWTNRDACFWSTWIKVEILTCVDHLNPQSEYFDGGGGEECF